MSSTDITVETPLMEQIVTPALDDGSVEPSITPLPEAEGTIPAANFTRALVLKGGGKFPQAIAHRGYKAMFPENTMGAFEGAVNVGAHAIETDIHLSKDGVVVLSHARTLPRKRKARTDEFQDATLKRCFGREEKVIDCTWEELSSVRTVREPRSPMPRLVDLLAYLAQPEVGHIWLVLDIKLDNNGHDVMRLIAEAISQVEAPAGRPWSTRVVLGCWAATYVSLCEQYLPGFPITHIGFSTVYAKQFFTVPNVSFNIMQQILAGPLGKGFIRKAQSLDRPVFAWTVNHVEMMRWCISHGLDGVVTDDPKLFLAVCDEWSRSPKVTRLSFKMWYDIIKINVLAFFFGFLFRWRHRARLDRQLMGARPRKLQAVEG